MKIRINDNDMVIDSVKNLKKILDELPMFSGNETVVVNKEYIAPNDYDNIIINNGDDIKIIKFLTGG